MNKTVAHKPKISLNSQKQAIFTQLRNILHADTLQDEPVVQSVSLFFWEQVEQWIQEAALVPKPFIIALTGPSGSGKSFVRQALESQIQRVSQVTSFTQDNYYRDFEADFTHLPLERFYDEIDFDDPAHIRFLDLERDLQRLKAQPFNSSIRLPRLRFGTPHQKPSILQEAIELTITPFIVTEGIHALYDTRILPYYNLKIYVDVDEQTRRNRWLTRNQLENRGITDNMWNTTVKCLEQHILPTRSLADLVINNNVSPERVAQLLENFIQALSPQVPRQNRDIA